jgi:hypothetical protein
VIYRHTQGEEGQERTETPRRGQRATGRSNPNQHKIEWTEKVWWEEKAGREEQRQGEEQSKIKTYLCVLRLNEKVKVGGSEARDKGEIAECSRTFFRR